MKSIVVLIIILTSIGCANMKEPTIEERMAATVRTFVQSMDSTVLIDSIAIVKIDTVTPLTLKWWEYVELNSEAEKKLEILKSQNDLALTNAKLYRVSKNNYFKESALEEKARVEELGGELQQLIDKSEGVLAEINSGSIDSTTFINYLVTARIVITNPDATRESDEIPIEMTSDFKIVKR